MTVSAPGAPQVDVRTGLPDRTAVPLPRSHGGERRDRRAERHRHVRRHVLVVVGATVGGLAIVVGLGATARLVIRATRPAATAALPAAPLTPAVADAAAPDLLRALVVQTGPAGLQAVTVLAVGPSGRGGDVVFLPAGTMVEQPAFGLNALRDGYVYGGVDLVQASVENLLGLSFATVAVVDGPLLERAVAPAGPLLVDVPDAVTAVDAAGRIQIVFASGPVSVAPERVGELLAAPGAGSDLDRLVRHQGFWAAWLAAVAADPEGAAPPASELGGTEAAVVSLAAGPVRYRVVPVQAVSTGKGADEDLYSVEGDLLDGLRAELVPDGSGAARIRVQVLNGTGAVSVSGLVQPLLVPAGASVELSGNADSFGYPRTQVVFYEDEDLAAARTVQEALGVGEVVRSQLDLGVVDVTVVVGADFLAAADRGSP